MAGDHWPSASRPLRMETLSSISAVHPGAQQEHAPAPHAASQHRGWGLQLQARITVAMEQARLAVLRHELFLEPPADALRHSWVARKQPKACFDDPTATVGFRRSAAPGPASLFAIAIRQRVAA